MNCPTGQTQLLTYPYKGSLEAERCSSSQRIWLTKKKLFAIERFQKDGYREQEETRILTARTQFSPSVEKSREFSCLSCRSPMYKHEHGYLFSMLVDTDTDRGSMWLDKGDITELETFLKKNCSDPTSFWEAFQQGLRSLFSIPS